MEDDSKEGIEIRPTGSYFQVDEDGYVVNPALLDKIQEDWKPLIEDIIEAYKTAYGEHLRQVYLRGSVAKGEAVKGVSDIDTFAYVDRPPGYLKEHRIDRGTRTRLENAYPFAEDIEMAALPLARVMGDRVILNQSVCVCGDPLEVPRMKPGKAMAIHAPAFRKRLAWFERFLAREESEEEARKGCVWLMKGLLRTGFELTMERSGRYTRDLYRCYETFAEYYPGKEAPMREALHYALNPTADKQKMKGVMDTLGRWLLTEIPQHFSAGIVNERPRKKVLISGSGVAGIICALSLDPGRYDVELVERADSFRNIGFSITLWRSGFALLKELLDAHGVPFVEGEDYFPVNGFTFFGGTRLGRLKKLSSEGYAWVIERERLMEILESALLSMIRPEQISFSTVIEGIQEDEEGVSMRFNDGRTRRYDFAIIAEGISSTTRALVFPGEERIVPLGQSLRYAWFDKETDLEDGGALFFTEGHIGVIHPPYARNLLGYYFSNGTSLEEQDAFERKMLAVVRQPGGQEASVDRGTSHVFDLKSVYLPRYHGTRVVLIGDAAHGRPPTLGFGTSMAIEDAVMICRTLNEAPSIESLGPSLEHFSRVRAARIEGIYRFQGFIHRFITSSSTKVRILSACLTLFCARYIEHRMKRFASYRIEPEPRSSGL